jgi:hypothetical protein
MALLQDSEKDAQTALEGWKGTDQDWRPEEQALADELHMALLDPMGKGLDKITSDLAVDDLDYFD